ncbi:MAG: pyridoxal-phosphate dependent enzyme [Ginsengibacter sp.]
MPHDLLSLLGEISNANIENSVISPVQLRIAQDMDIKISMLRLDKVHPVISGNKLFKLSYYLQETLLTPHKTIITFGGAYSNHLAATAYACKLLNIKCIGLVRGEKPAILSDTLVFCRKNEMELEFLSREEYRKIASKPEHAFLKEKYGDHCLIPEGGYSTKGMLGASLICDYYTSNQYTHICLPVGTATTLAGIIKNTNTSTNIIGFPALKGMMDISERLHFLKIENFSNLSLVHDYHFGGFGKKTPKLVYFMNQFYREQQIPLDVVYTAKMMFGVQDMVQKKYFPAGSDILCIHTGGLQGHRSIKEMLEYGSPLV